MRGLTCLARNMLVTGAAKALEGSDAVIGRGLSVHLVPGAPMGHLLIILIIRAIMSVIDAVINVKGITVRLVIGSTARDKGGEDLLGWVETRTELVVGVVYKVEVKMGMVITKGRAMNSFGNQARQGRTTAEAMLDPMPVSSMCSSARKYWVIA